MTNNDKYCPITPTRLRFPFYRPQAAETRASRAEPSQAAAPPPAGAIQAPKQHLAALRACPLVPHRAFAW